MYYTIEDECECEDLPYPKQIRSLLFLGCAESARNFTFLKSHQITHVIDLTGKAPPFPQEFKYLTIPHVDDKPESDILRYFPDCIKFVTEAWNNKDSVLIHCKAGVSRSPTVVCAVLMALEGKSIEQAIHEIRIKKDDIQPNYGFMHQLFLWQQMEFSLIGGKKWNRFYQLQAHSALQSKRFSDISSWGKDPTSLVHSDLTDYGLCGNVDCSVKYPLKGVNVGDCDHFQETSTVFCCRNCDRWLFTEDNVFPHPKRTGKLCVHLHTEIYSCFVKENGLYCEINHPLGCNCICCQTSECDSFKIEPMEWMEDLDCAGGQICCPECKTKLGDYVWSEQQCTCLSIIRPSFAISKSLIYVAVFV